MTFYATTAIIIYFLIGLIFLLIKMTDKISQFERCEDVTFEDCDDFRFMLYFIGWPVFLEILVVETVKIFVVKILWKLTHREKERNNK